MLLAAAASDARRLAGAVAAAAALSLDSPFLRGDGADADADAERTKGRRAAAEASRALRDDARACSTTKTATRSPPRARSWRTTPSGIRVTRTRRGVEHRLHGKTMREMSDLDDRPSGPGVAATDGGGGCRRRRRRRLTGGASRRRRRRRRHRAREGGVQARVATEGRTRRPPRRRKPLAVGRAVGSRVGGVGGAFAGRRRASTRASRRLGGSRRAPRHYQAAEAAAAAERARGRGCNGRTRATRYRPAMLDATVFLRPTSALHRTSPEYVVYVDVIQTAKRPYLARHRGGWRALVDRRARR